jgi:Kef-type K+ transport system membrane component KefB
MTWDTSVVTFFIGATFALFYTALNLNEVHNILKWLLFSMGVFMLSIGSYFCVYLLNANVAVNAQYYTLPLTILSVWLVVLFVIYFIGFFTWGLLQKLIGKDNNAK